MKNAQPVDDCAFDLVFSVYIGSWAFDARPHPWKTLLISREQAEGPPSPSGMAVLFSGDYSMTILSPTEVRFQSFFMLETGMFTQPWEPSYCQMSPPKLSRQLASWTP